MKRIFGYCISCMENTIKNLCLRDTWVFNEDLRVSGMLGGEEESHTHTKYVF